jgi:hypothetical protein
MPVQPRADGAESVFSSEPPNLDLSEDVFGRGPAAAAADLGDEAEPLEAAEPTTVSAEEPAEGSAEAVDETLAAAAEPEAETEPVSE